VTEPRPSSRPSSSPRPAPPRAFTFLLSAVLGVVVYFALKILLAAPGNVLALVCLALMGLTAGNLVRRHGLNSPETVSAAAAILVGALTALLLHT